MVYEVGVSSSGSGSTWSRVVWNISICLARVPRRVYGEPVCMPKSAVILQALVSAKALGCEVPYSANVQVCVGGVCKEGNL